MATEMENKGRQGERQANDAWEKILKAGVAAQRFVPGSICVGGTAVALYAHHRISHDTDHLLPNLRSRFEEVLAALESQPDWKTARVQPPVLILGSIEQVQVGFRQVMRSSAVETKTLDTPAGKLVVPTLDELLCMKAFLAYRRNAARDYLDFAALSTCAPEKDVIASLLKLDERYGEIQTVSVGLEVAKVLSAAAPFDLNEAELQHYKGLAEKWQKWGATRSICNHFGVLLGEALVNRQR